MVTSNKQHTQETPAKQDPENTAPDPNKINASTPSALVQACRPWDLGRIFLLPACCTQEGTR